MKHIQMHTYSSSDWHDWREETELLKVNDSVYINDEDVLPAIADALVYYREDKDELKSKIIKDLTEKGKCNFQTEEGYWCEGIEKTDTGYIYYSSDYFEMHVYFDIYDVNDVVYLPVRQYICCPKWSPLASRCFCEPFNSYEAAKAYRMPSGCHVKHYDEEKDTVIVFNKDFSSEWYDINKELFNNYDANLFEKRFSESPSVHKIAMNITVKKIDNNNIYYDYNGKSEICTDYTGDWDRVEVGLAYAIIAKEYREKEKIS